MNHTQFRWYLASMAAFTVPQSIHMVVYSWLVTIYLAETGDRVGIAQMAGMLPGLVLILGAGMVAERVDLRRLLISVHLIAALPLLALAGILYSGLLTYPLVLVYAVSAGAASAIGQPARDAMVSRLAGAEIQKAVTISVGAMFGLQLVGFMIASTTAVVGPLPLLLLSAFGVAAGSVALFRMEPAPPAASERRPSIHDISDALKLVIASERMRPAFLLIFSLGLFFGGTYMVIVPLYLREIYGAGATAIAGGFAAFMVGTVVSTVIMVRSGGARRQGRALLLSLASGAIVLLPLSLEPPQWVFFVCLILWGMGGGVAMSMSRTLMQEASPPQYRARVMAVFSLGNLGGVPLGALFMGYAARYLGPENAILVACAGIALVCVTMLLTTRLWALGPLPSNNGS